MDEGWDGKGIGMWMPRNSLLGETSTHMIFFLLWLESKDDPHLKHRFAITNLTRARLASTRPTLCFSFSSLPSCAHAHVLVYLQKNILAGLERGDFFIIIYIYIKF